MFSSLLKKSETFENEAQFVVDCIVERPYPRRPLERFAGFEELVQVSVSVTKPIKPLKVVGLSKSVIPKKCYGPGDFQGLYWLGHAYRDLNEFRSEEHT